MTTQRIEVRLTPLQVVTLQMGVVGMGRCRTRDCDNWTSGEFCADCEEERNGQYVSARSLAFEQLKRLWNKARGWLVWLAFWTAAWAVALF